MRVYARFLLSLLALSLAVAWLFSSASNTNHKRSDEPRRRAGGGSAASSGVIPNNLARLIEHTDVIIEGTILSIGTPTWYDPPPTAGPTATPDAWRPYGVPSVGGIYTFYNVRVTAIYKNNEDLEVDDIITLAASTDINPFFGPFIGDDYDAYLYFLSKYEYDDLYSMPYGDYGRLLIGNSPARYTDPDFSPVPFATAMSIPTLISEIEDEVDRQSTATITPMPTSTPDPANTEEWEN